MKTLILATSNPGKIREFQELLTGIECIPQSNLGIQDADETGLSFIENAILKARHASKIAQAPALADDSGLVVKALGGQPGIYSARYAGKKATNEDNIKLLLETLVGIEENERQAYFYCVIAVVKHPNDPIPLIATGHLEGQITLTPKGNQGFGYDPVFYIPSQKCTAAELSLTIKNSISHRALALQQLHKKLTSDYFE
jgi:XTP/dITP diphosphohydrolase